MKIVINDDYGGFSLSRQAFLRLREMGHPMAKAEPDYGEFFSDGSGPHKPFLSSAPEPGSFLRDIPRNDPLLISVVEEIGTKAEGHSASLKIVEIPDDVKWHIEEYDGAEHVAEDHRTWR